MGVSVSVCVGVGVCDACHLWFAVRVPDVLCKGMGESACVGV